ncbi:hypothetical protein LOCUS_51440 [Klebsiella pneumoniae]|nr:hypothetical protein KML001_49370 [Klebsiella quasipneumoniae subsp. similipneumoniae]GMA04413.1 hypothetical protein KML003_45380 [Klebsiella quasipneumoniae subsp. similipneumoniae]GMX30304.1 hypothetical protein LOCUS_51440 [Klebsiella pneumoniae]
MMIPAIPGETSSLIYTVIAAVTPLTAIPSSARKITKTCHDGASAHSNVKTPPAKRDANITGLRPKRSDNEPLNNMANARNPTSADNIMPT